MKFRYKFSFVLLLPLCLSLGIIERIPAVLNSPSALYKLTGQENVDFDIEVSGRSGVEYTLVARLFNNKTDALVFAQTYSGIIGKTDNTAIVNYPLKNRLNSNGLKFEYLLSYYDRNVSFSSVLYPFVPLSINAMQYRNERYLSEGRFIKLTNKGIVTEEMFSFANYNEFLSKNDKNILDFSTVKFSFMNEYDLRYTKAEFHIKDYYDVYPLFPKVDDEVVFDMDCINKDNEYTFKINQKMYVNKKTLDMSPIWSKECQQTTSLYVPIRKQDLLKESDCYILLKEAGYSAVDIIFPLTFYFDKLLIGLCYESDYCIEGGIKE